MGERDRKLRLLHASWHCAKLENYIKFKMDNETNQYILNYQYPLPLINWHIPD